MKIVHAADLHLDSPLRGLTEYEGAPVLEVRSATRRALSSLVDLCLTESAQLLVLAGDLYDGDFKDFSTALFFTAQMARLRESGTQVVWIRGNHDAANRMTTHLQVLPHVRELATSHPETVVFERWGVAVHGQGYASRELRDNLAALYPEPRAGLFNLGLLHTALDGREGHAPYAPCVSSQLLAKGYEYWALGHVHQREVVHRDPWIVFPGNLQGRHIKECGPKGCMLLDVQDARVESARFCVLDHVRWEACDVDLSEVEHLDDVLDRASSGMRQLREDAGGRTLSLRVRLIGETRAHSLLVQQRERIENELRARSLEMGDVYLERIQFATRSRLVAGSLLERHDAVGDLFRSLERMAEDSDHVKEMWEVLLGPLGGVPTELLRHDDLQPEDILREARRLLEGRLVASGDPT